MIHIIETISDRYIIVTIQKLYHYVVYNVKTFDQAVTNKLISRMRWPYRKKLLVVPLFFNVIVSTILPFHILGAIPG